MCFERRVMGLTTSVNKRLIGKGYRLIALDFLLSNLSRRFCIFSFRFIVVELF